VAKSVAATRARLAPEGSAPVVLVVLRPGDKHEASWTIAPL